MAREATQRELADLVGRVLCACIGSAATSGGVRDPSAPGPPRRCTCTVGPGMFGDDHVVADVVPTTGGCRPPHHFPQCNQNRPATTSVSVALSFALAHASAELRCNRRWFGAGTAPLLPARSMVGVCNIASKATADGNAVFRPNPIRSRNTPFVEQ